MNHFIFIFREFEVNTGVISADQQNEEGSTVNVKILLVNLKIINSFFLLEI